MSEATLSSELEHFMREGDKEGLIQRVLQKPRDLEGIKERQNPKIRLQLYPYREIPSGIMNPLQRLVSLQTHSQTAFTGIGEQPREYPPWEQSQVPDASYDEHREAELYDLSQQGCFDAVTLGRREGSNLVLPDARASRDHMLVFFDGTQVYALDWGTSNWMSRTVGSGNGSFLNANSNNSIINDLIVWDQRDAIGLVLRQKQNPPRCEYVLRYELI